LDDGWVVPGIHGADEIGTVNALGFMLRRCVNVEWFVDVYDSCEW